MCGANGTENSREASRAPGQRAAAPAPTLWPSLRCSHVTPRHLRVTETHPLEAVLNMSVVTKFDF